MSGGLTRAHATLDRGARFLSAGLRPQQDAAPAAIAGRYRAKVIGNGLRELDRFLNLLLDEASLRIGFPARPGQRNTANKLRQFRIATGVDREGDLERLHALGRSRDCLFYSGGIVTRGDFRSGPSMTAGWSGPDLAKGLRRFGVGEELEVTAADLAGICAFYEALAAEVVAGSAMPRTLTPRRKAPPG
ncbi:hypothetical protein ACMGDH_13460 [Sphingomonas sp. DT-207]|uniref:hypothetical protein n=1 Tax=Sphingomonas sp. DT-207 TaxID=3396167 RepID=UPI003F1D9B1C